MTKKYTVQTCPECGADNWFNCHCTAAYSPSVVMEARIEAAKWYRRAIKAEKELQEAHDKYSIRILELTEELLENRIKYSAERETNDKLKAQLAAANAEMEHRKQLAMNENRNAEILRGRWIDACQKLARFEADDSTVICPKCGTEFAPAKSD